MTALTDGPLLGSSPGPTDHLESRRRAHEDLSAVKRAIPILMLAMLVLTAHAGFAASPDAALSGTVRDVHGTPQMGALIELLSADATTVATAFSDQHGRYILPSVMPGRYQLRATAAFFIPALRNNLHLQPGVQAIVNLTMSTMFDAENWLPAQRRRADEPADDWKWALRSTANRPLLRLVDPESGVELSSSAEQPHKAYSQGRITLTNGTGSFGDGGMHQALMLNRTMGDGDSAMLRADLGEIPTGTTPASAPSVSLSTGFERRSPLGGSTRLMSSFQSHPELETGLAQGFQVLQVASAEQLTLGDAVMIDVGTLIAAERLEATRIESEPYLRVTGRPGDNVVVEYRFATGRQLQSSDDLDHLNQSLTALTDAQGRPLKTKGFHQELSVSRKLGQTVVTGTVFTDKFAQAGISGTGVMNRTTLQEAAVVADPTTGTYQVAAAGYSGRGMSVAVMQPLTAAISAWAEYDLGTALRGSMDGMALQQMAQSVTPALEQAASVTVRGRILRTGTSIKAEYRWQPARTLTQVNAYNASPEEAYLSFYVRQRLWCGRFLPQGLDAVVEATNLLEQGYRPVLAPDGQTLFLAQVPQAIQGGLAFNF